MAKKQTRKPKTTSSNRIQLTAAERREVERLMNIPEIRQAITNGKEDVDAEECFLPLLLLMGLWGGSRAMRGRAGGGLFGGRGLGNFGGMGMNRFGNMGGYGGLGAFGGMGGYGGPGAFGGMGGYGGPGAFGGMGGYGGPGAFGGMGGYGGPGAFGGMGGMFGRRFPFMF